MNKEIKRLAQAINAMPMETERQRMLAAVQHNLCSLQVSINSSFGRDFFPVLEYAQLGFVPHTTQAQWIDEVQDAYIDAVKALPMGYDIFGELHAEQFNNDKSRLSQHFTPPGIARFIAHSCTATPDPTKTIEVGDPTGCGSGALVLAALSTELPMNILINDIDPLCTAMTTLQVLANFAFKDAQVKRLTAYRSDVITDYLTSSPVFVFDFNVSLEVIQN
ncbi:hypothetical protein [Stenotrophomonas acidaminiphila]